MRSITILISVATLFFLYSFQTNECANLPANNKKIITFVKSQIGKKCGEGCSDLFYKAYEKAGLMYVPLAWGDTVNYANDCVYPGDVLVLNKVDIYWENKGKTTGLKYDSRIEYFIIKVKARGLYTVANTQSTETGRKVMTEDLGINTYKGEKPKVYRPGSHVGRIK